MILVGTLGLLLASVPAGLRASDSQRPGAVAAPPLPTSSGPIAEAVPLVNKVLTNGLDIVVLEDHSIPLVTVELAVRNGSLTEPPELNGLSHLYEHMFFKSNKATTDRAEYLSNIDQLGIIYNGTTQEEVVEYYFTTTSPNFPVAMRFMRDSVRYPTFDPGEFTNEREVVIGEIDRAESNPFSLISNEMNNRLFYKYPSRKNPAGNRQTVRGATTEMMRLIQGRYYVPNNSAVIITGDIEPAEAFKVAQELRRLAAAPEGSLRRVPAGGTSSAHEERGRHSHQAGAERRDQHRLAGAVDGERRCGDVCGGRVLVHPAAVELTVSAEPGRYRPRGGRESRLLLAAQRRAHQPGDAGDARQGARGGSRRL